MDVDVEDYVDSFRPHIMDVVYAWCNGASFGQICKMTDIFEGKFSLWGSIHNSTFYFHLYSAKSDFDINCTLQMNYCKDLDLSDLVLGDIAAYFTCTKKLTRHY